MMLTIALAAFFIGSAAGFALARREMLRSLVGLILGLTGVVVFAMSTAPAALPGDGVAAISVAYLMAAPMASGTFCGAIVAWLMRARSGTS